MNLISAHVLDQATKAFHAALDRHDNDAIHDRDDERVDGSVDAIVEALLMNGWTPPQPPASAS